MDREVDLRIDLLTKMAVAADSRASAMGTTCSCTGDAFDHRADNAYIGDMATLNIRNLPDEVHRRLRIRTAGHGRSMEAEARAILCEAVNGNEHPDGPVLRARRLQAFVDKLYGGNKPQNVVDDFIAERRREAAREESE